MLFDLDQGVAYPAADILDDTITGEVSVTLHETARLGRQQNAFDGCQQRTTGGRIGPRNMDPKRDRVSKKPL